jgi:hypothetical protein
LENLLSSHEAKKKSGSIYGTIAVNLLMANNAVGADAHRVSKTQMQCFVYARQDMENGPLVIILPKDSMWNKFYVRNFYSNQDAKLVKAFCNRFCLFLELVVVFFLNDLFDRWCWYKSNYKKVSPVELLILGLLRYLGRRSWVDL